MRFPRRKPLPGMAKPCLPTRNDACARPNDARREAHTSATGAHRCAVRGLGCATRGASISYRGATPRLSRRMGLLPRRNAAPNRGRAASSSPQCCASRSAAISPIGATLSVPGETVSSAIAALCRHVAMIALRGRSPDGPQPQIADKKKAASLRLEGDHGVRVSRYAALTSGVRGFLAKRDPSDARRSSRL